jgi:hypothetical protein
MRNDARMKKPNSLQRLFPGFQRRLPRAFGKSGQVQETNSRTILVPDKQWDDYDQEDLAYADEQLEEHGNRSSMAPAPGDPRDEPSHIGPAMINDQVIRPDGVAMTYGQPAVGCSTMTETTAADSVQCDSCRDTFSVAELYRSPCSHRFCETCLETIIKTAMADESRFPPRCCKQELGLSIPPKVAREYSAKLDEFGTPYNKRVYCQQRTCSKFIPQYWIVGDIALCFHCGQKTCAICKSAPHGDADCPQDLATIALLALANKKGYQRCYNCRRLVELRNGCNKISESMYQSARHLHRPS